MPDKTVAYYRVSTQRQGQSGLGLEAQEAAVRELCKGTLIASFTEVESGANTKRPELAKAMVYCKAAGATLVVAKLDRLARNVAFVASLMEAGVDFIAADMPQANRLTIHILAAVAEHEREAISARTKAALAAAKARGVRLGSNGRKLAGQNRAAALARAEAMLPELIPLVRRADSIRHLARLLDEAGIPTVKGGKWAPEQARQLLKRVLSLKKDKP